MRSAPIEAAGREVFLKILSIDTSSRAGSILLGEDQKVLGEINLDSSETHSVRLLSGVDYLLKNLGIRLLDLDAFAVVSGPGSFTGIRIGLTTVKGLADSTSKPVIPITALEAWVEKFPRLQGTIVPLIDARRGEVYWAVFERVGEAVRELTAGRVDKPAQMLSQLVQDEILFIGGGAAQYRDLLINCHPPGWKVAACDPFLGRSMVPIAYQRARHGQFTSALDLQAYYLRRSDAEIYWKEE